MLVASPTDPFPTRVTWQRCAPVNAGSRERIVLTDHPDKRLAIAIQTIEHARVESNGPVKLSAEEEQLFVPLRIGQETVLVSIKSAIKRLGATEQDLRVKSAAGLLSNYLRKLSVARLLMDDGNTFARRTTSCLLSGPYVLEWGSAGKPSNVYEDTGIELGKGAFGSVRMLASISSPLKGKALKKAHVPEGNSQLLNGAGKLSAIQKHYNHLCCGLPAPSSRASSPVDSDSTMGLLSDVYTTDLHKAILKRKEWSNVLDPKTLASGLLQLVGGLWYLEDMGIDHGDIKDGNIFIHILEGGYIVFCLHDFDGSKFMRNGPNGIKPEIGLGSGLGTSFTPGRMYDSDWKLLKEAENTGNLEMYIRGQHSRDLLGVGLSICKALVKGLPYELGPMIGTGRVLDTTKPTKVNYKALLEKTGFGSAMTACLLQIISPDIQLRGTAKTIIRELVRAYQHDYSDRPLPEGFPKLENVSSSSSSDSSFQSLTFTLPAAASQTSSSSNKVEAEDEDGDHSMTDDGSASKTVVLEARTPKPEDAAPLATLKTKRKKLADAGDKTGKEEKISSQERPLKRARKCKLQLESSQPSTQ